MTKFEKTVRESKPTKVEPIKHSKFGAMKATYTNGMAAVVKPQRDVSPFDRPMQRGLLISTQPAREVAFYKLAQMLAFDDVVPETLLIMHDGKQASAQIFTPTVHLHQLQPMLLKKEELGQEGWVSLLQETCRAVPKRLWVRLLILDIIAGSRDRHINNVGVVVKMKEPRPEYSILGWDNACTFGATFAKYHNVFHKYLFKYAVQLEAHWDMLEKFTLVDFTRVLGELLNPIDVAQAYERLQFMLEYPYRLPWRVMSQGHDDSDSFPSYSAWFGNHATTEPVNSLVVAI